jgi:hypothetical protein
VDYEIRQVHTKIFLLINGNRVNMNSVKRANSSEININNESMMIINNKVTNGVYDQILIKMHLKGKWQFISQRRTQLHK